jgi:hypothetical protein
MWTPASQPDAAIGCRRETGARRAQRQVSLACSGFGLPSLLPRLKTAAAVNLLLSRSGREVELELTLPQYCWICVLAHALSHTMQFQQIHSTSEQSTDLVNIGVYAAVANL